MKLRDGAEADRAGRHVAVTGGRPGVQIAVAGVVTTTGEGEPFATSVLPRRDQDTLLPAERPLPSHRRQPPAGGEPRTAGSTHLPDLARRLGVPADLLEPVLAGALAAVAAAVAWGIDAPGLGLVPLTAVPAVGLLALVAPDLPGGRAVRALLLAAAGAAAGVVSPLLVPMTLLVAVATAAVYPALLRPAAGRLVAAASLAALAAPLVTQALDRPAGNLAEFLLAGTDDAAAGRLALACGMAVVAVLAWSGLLTGRALDATATLAERRGRDARLASAELTRAGSIDPLTGLPNREALLRELTVVLTRRDPLGPDTTGLLVVDVDRFDRFAESYGLTVADDVVRQVARRLRAVRPEGDMVARIDRHQFAVLPAATVDDEDCDAVARRVLGVLERPIGAGGEELSVTCSVGIAVQGPGMETAAAMVQAADEAVRAAQLGGRSRIETSDQALRAHTASQARLELELREAVAEGLVSAVFQPVLALGREPSRDRVVGVETLARWTRRDGTSVPPQRFVPLADELGLGVTLGLQLVDRTLDALAAWRHAGYAVDQVWVNLAPSQLLDPEFAPMVSARLAGRGLPPSSLMVEVPAGSFTDDEQAVSTLGRLRSLGVGVALDNFGHAGTSLTALRHLPVTMLKLDHGLAPEFARRGPVARAVTALARELGLRVVAAGIESAEQLEGARALLADGVQGYAVAVPTSAAEVAGFLPRAEPAWAPEPQPEPSAPIPLPVRAREGTVL